MTLRHVPLGQLMLSPFNPRKTEPPAAEIEALADSIESCGLLQNLIGYEQPVCELGEDGLTTHHPVWITGGGRRLRALQLLEDKLVTREGHVETTVPVWIEPTMDDAVSAAIAENEVRVDMTPIERLHAYQRQIELGVPLAVIARRYATDVRGVEKIVALAVVEPTILAALERGEIDLETARAFTVTTDHNAQLHVFSRLHYYHNPSQIRSALKKDAVAAVRNARLKFVGREAYVEAGGSITEDLFSEDVWVDDPNLLDRLVQERLDREAELLVADGWSWASADPTFDRFAFERIYPGEAQAEHLTPLSEEERAELNALLEKADAEDEWTYEDQERWAELEERAEIPETEGDAPVVDEWSVDQKAVAGCHVRLTWDGEMQAVCGYVRAEDRPRAIDLGVVEATPEDRAHGEPGVLGGQAVGDGVEDAVVVAEQDPPAKPLSGALVASLKGLRLVAVQNAVLKQPDLALDLLAWHMSQRLHILDCHFGSGELMGGETLGLEQDAGLHDWRANEPLTLAEFRGKGKRHRNGILAGMIARAMRSWSAHEMGHVEHAAGVELRRVWTPTATLFERMTVAQCMAIYREVAGRPMEQDHIGAVAGNLRKPDVVRVMVDLFANPQRALAGDPEAIARARAWLPGPMLEGRVAPAPEPEAAAPAVLALPAPEAAGEAAPTEEAPADTAAEPETAAARDEPPAEAPAPSKRRKRGRATDAIAA